MIQDPSPAPPRVEKIGVIGTGVMGGAMARRLLACGFDVAVFDANFKAMAGLADLGAVLEPGPRNVADRSDLILCSLPSADISIGVAQAVAGAEGVKVYMETSTIGRGAIVEISDLLGRSGIMTIDAPVSGGSFAIAEGKLTAFLAGPAAAIALARPLIDALSSTVFELGAEVGRAQLCKVINNGVGLAGLIAACEGLALAQRAGIGMELMLDILNSGSGSNWATRQMLPNTLLAGRPSGPISITVKDLGFYLSEAEMVGGAVPVARDLMARLQRIVAEGDPQRDTTALFSYFVELAKANKR
jgi:3-hydroxyisobutyrate dehydrogenase-like beta-hydroxyacid dehydrogenase